MSLPRIGISACLTGQRVRHDGRDKRSDTLLAALEGQAELIPVCPEVELGMGVPREPVELGGVPTAPRMRGVRSGADHTDAMQAWALRRVEELSRAGLDGYVLMERSPSCGLRGVPVGAGAGAGLFAATLVRLLPRLPVEEAGQLADSDALEAFLRSVRAHVGVRE